MADGAKEGYDGLDSFQPPLLADRNVAVYSENADGGMTEDLRPLNPNGAVWPLRLLTGDRDAKIHLTLRNAAQLPNTAFEAYLIDDDQQMAYNLKTVHSMTLNSMQGTRALRLLVGTRAFVLANQGAVEAVPTTMRLSTNYPNPFNPTTTIRYTVPGEAAQYEVTLKVYNMLGQEIRSLVSEMQSAGYYEVSFEGRNLSTGVYFYRISVGGPGVKTMTAVKKMMLVK
jgi:hypothetical protein